MKRQEDNILINILTRTSNRPVGFNNLRYTIINQTYKNVRHIVSYDNDADLEYLHKHDIHKVRVNVLNHDNSNHPDGFTPATYNLYCNELLDQVDNGWVWFLDDDVNIFHNNVLEQIVSHIKKSDTDTMFFWQSRYPDKTVIPGKKRIKEEKIEMYNIDTSCFLFHSKYKNQVRWDGWKVSDYRFIKALSEFIPKKVWINKVYVQINNQGDLGNRNDIQKSGINKIIFYKTFFWYFIPKYHYQMYGLYVFKSDFLKLLLKRLKMSLWYRLKKIK